MNQITEAGVTIATAIIGVAIISVILSKKANTPNVIQALASGFGNVLNVAISPVTGNDTRGTLAYPGQSGGAAPGVGSGFGLPAFGM